MASTKKVLIVDDEEDLLEMLQLRFEAAGFEVATAGDGEKGLQQAKAFRPDIILLDLLMPGVDGWEMHRKLKSLPELERTSVLVMTAASPKPVEDRARREGVARIVLKPVDGRRLVESLKLEMQLHHRG